MHQTLSKRIINCLAVMMFLITCTSCKTVEPYIIRDYLKELAVRSGINDGTSDYIVDLQNWNVIKEEDVTIIDQNLDYLFLAKTIGRLIENNEDYLQNLKDKKWIKNSAREDDLVNSEKAIEIIDRAVEVINNQVFEDKYEIDTKDEIYELDDYSFENNVIYSNKKYEIGDIVYLKDENEYKKIVGFVTDGYKVEDASYEDFIESLNLQGSFEVDMDEAIDIPYGEVIEESSLYVNNKRTTLASKPKRKTFNSEGFRISYSFNSSGIDAHISKNVKGVNAFFDVSLSGIRPTYKWNYKNGNIEEAYFKVDYKASEELGASIGKYNKYYFDLKDKNASSFMNAAKSLIKTKDDEVEATIKICKIKTPIPNMPTVYFNIDVLVRIYTTGKVEIVLSNKNTTGLEIRNNHMRIINDSNKDIDFAIGGSSKACLGVNFNLEAAKKRLMDVEADIGARASVSTTVHLYDEDGNKKSEISELTYSSLDDISRENENVKVCGDVSLNWLLDLKLNTSKTLLSKFGFSKTKSILDEDNQILGNKTHIENGVFVDRCTRKDKFHSSDKETVTFNVDKILLDKYSVVVDIGKTYKIPIRALPEGYSFDNLSYSSVDYSVASVSKEGIISGNKMGACEIKIKTTDNKYSASINVLVSSG